MSTPHDPPLGAAPLSDVFLKSFQGFAGRLKSLMPEKRMPVVDSTYEAYKAALARQNKKLEYPFAAVTCGGTDVNVEGYNPKALLRRGQLGASRADGPGTNIVDATYHLVPVIADIQVIFITNSAADMYTFGQRWTLAAMQNLFQMHLESEASSDRRRVAPIHVRVDLGRQIQYPQQMPDDEGAELRVEVGAQMRTYMGHVRERLRIVGTSMNFQLGTPIGANTRLTDQIQVQTRRGAGGSRVQEVKASNFNGEQVTRDDR